jgi:hypothetical protein
MSWLTTHAVEVVLNLWILLFQWINLYLLCNIKSFTFRSSLWRGKSIMKYNDSGLNRYKHTVWSLRSKHFIKKSWKNYTLYCHTRCYCKVCYHSYGVLWISSCFYSFFLGGHLHTNALWGILSLGVAVGWSM